MIKSISHRGRDMQQELRNDSSMKNSSEDSATCYTSVSTSNYNDGPTSESCSQKPSFCLVSPLICVVCAIFAFAGQIVIRSKEHGHGWLDQYLHLLSSSQKSILGFGVSILVGLIFGHFCAKETISWLPARGSIKDWKKQVSRGTGSALKFLSLFGIVVCIALQVTSQASFLNGGETFSVRILWGLSAIALLVTTLFIRYYERSKAKGEASPPFTKFTFALLLVIVASGFYLRGYDLANLPITLNQDNSGAGLFAMENLSERGWHLIGIGEFGIPKIAFSFLSISLMSFGKTVFGLRAVEVLFGTSMLLATYLFVWRSFDSHRLAALAAALLAAHAGHIHFSRHVMNIDPWAFATFGLFFLVHGVRSCRIWPLGLAGLFLGFSLQLYLSSRVLLFVTPLFLIYLWNGRRKVLRDLYLGWGLFALGGVIAIGPNLSDLYINYWAWEYSNRVGSTFFHIPTLYAVAAIYEVTTIPELLATQFESVLKLFQLSSDKSGQIHCAKPLFDLMIAPFMWLGLGVSITAWRRNPALSLCSMIFAMTLLVGQIFCSGVPYWPKLISVMLTGIIFIAIGIDRTCSALIDIVAYSMRLLGLDSLRTRAYLSSVAAIGLTALVMTDAFREWSLYYPIASSSHGPVEVAGRFIEKLPNNTKICGISESGAEIAVTRQEILFYSGSRVLQDFRGVSPQDAIGRCEPGPFVWLISVSQPELREALVGRYPNGNLIAHKGQAASPILWTFSSN